MVAATNLCSFSTFGKQISALCFFYLSFFSSNFHTCQWNMMPQRIFLGHQPIKLQVSPIFSVRYSVTGSSGHRDLIVPKIFQMTIFDIKKTNSFFSVDQELTAVSFRTNPTNFTKIQPYNWSPHEPAQDLIQITSNNHSTHYDVNFRPWCGGTWVADYKWLDFHFKDELYITESWSKMWGCRQTLPSAGHMHLRPWMDGFRCLLSKHCRQMWYIWRCCQRIGHHRSYIGINLHYYNCATPPEKNNSSQDF